MAEVIKLVANDNLPQIQITLTDDVTGNPIDLSDPLTVINVKFRAAGAATILATLPCTKKTTGIDGIVLFSFPGATLAVAAGAYEGEIEISFNGLIQTVYESLKFRVRSDF